MDHFCLQNEVVERFGINLRYPQKFEFEEAIQRFTKEIKAYGFDLEYSNF
jgi:hypothetical protein